MIRKHKWELIVSSLVILIPVLVGLILWNRLPSQMPTHWGFDGTADGWSGKAFAVFGMPLILLAVHWLCVLASSADPRHKNYHPKMLALVLWICPVIALVLSTLVYTTALRYPIKVEIIMPLLVGLMFIVVGNLLPKCRQSYTLGIKLPWTLADEENWDRTHRLAGKLWMVGGLLMFTMPFWGKAGIWIFIISIFVMVLIPTFYSYYLYSKRQKS